MTNILYVARRELAAFFGSPVAYIFIGTFLAVSLFVFFWVDAFFARNIADARPLFEWMPILLVLLCAALTMRMWSEERRAGTLENLLTLPVATPKLVLGKFLAALGLVTVALALTLPLPLTVALLGPLDWGPVIGAYLAALLLAAAYIAIGLFVSARTDNPIVALIGATLVSAAFYVIGSPALTSLVGHGGGEVLRLLGSGARFESITRGVIDMRDLYYYLSLTGVFLALTIHSLERLRWAEPTANPRHHRRWTLVTGLAVANLLAANIWMQGISGARADLTEGRLYSLSEATHTYLAQLQEPLLIRGYFSAQTHPLLAPLVPQLRDLLEEYQVAGGDQVRVEIVDPQQSPELEREAGEQYGIRPVAFQTATKYQAAVVNSYFDILIQYGDQYETLSFQDLIDVKVRGELDLDVRLRHPEYDLTRTIRKVLQGYQGGGDPFAHLSKPLTLKAFVSAAEHLPAPLPELRAELTALLEDLKTRSQGRFNFELQDPSAGDGALAKTIQEQYGFEPLVMSLLDPTPFYFYLVLEDGSRHVPVPLPESLDRAGLNRALEAAIKRFAPGVLRTVALFAPTPEPNPLAMGASGSGDYSLLRQTLQESFNVRDTDLTSGQVPDDADVLFVIGPEALDAKQRFALDQFLMQGGTVMIAASSFNLDLSGGTITARKLDIGLNDWFAHHGLKIESSLVLDPNNTPFPIPVQRDLGGFAVQEIQTLDYPYFPDIRGAGLAENHPITAGLGQITLNWSSPLTLDTTRQNGRTVTHLLQSSEAAWSSDSEMMQPDFTAHGALGFPIGTDRGRKLLAVALEGRFTSPFAGQPSPLLTPDEKKPESTDPNAPPDEPKTDDQSKPPIISGVIDSSPESARLIVIGSASFLGDTAISLANEATQSRYLKPLELVQNALDWALEDRGLLALRSQSQFGRLLDPIGREARVFWETLNYLLALGGLALVYLLHRRARARRARDQAALLGHGG